MYYANMKQYDVANAKGISATLFVSGCNFNCYNCFNKEAQSFTYGKEFTKQDEDIFLEYCNNPRVTSISLLGGEVTQQDPVIILNLIKRIKHETNKPIWIWTGDLFENLITKPQQLEILKNIDVLIDGKFVQELKNLKLKYRGSSNQRIIDVQKSLRENCVIQLNYE